LEIGFRIWSQVWLLPPVDKPKALAVIIVIGGVVLLRSRLRRGYRQTDRQTDRQTKG
jgi:hypothetical protein